MAINFIFFGLNCESIQYGAVADGNDGRILRVAYGEDPDFPDHVLPDIPIVGSPFVEPSVVVEPLDDDTTYTVHFQVIEPINETVVEEAVSTRTTLDCDYYYYCGQRYDAGDVPTETIQLRNGSINQSYRRPIL